MKKQYDIKDVVKRYARSYLRFLKENNLIYKDKEELFELLSYSIKCIYKQEAVEFNSLIADYGDYCVFSLRSVYKVPEKLNLVDTVKLVGAIQTYFVMLMENNQGY